MPLTGPALTDRQTEIVDAALRLLAKEGMPNVTLRAVAAESGWSLGAVQKAFVTKSALITAMLHRTRITATPSAFSRETPDLWDWLTELIVSLQPLDESRREVLLRALAFDQLAQHDPEVAEALTESDTRLRQGIASRIRVAQELGQINREIDGDMVGRHVLALVEGLAAQMLYDPVTEEEGRRIAAYAANTLLCAGFGRPGSVRR